MYTAEQIPVALDIIVCDVIDSKDAPNYKQYILDGENGEEYSVTIQKMNGETPCQQLAAEKEKHQKTAATLTELVSILENSEVSEDVKELILKAKEIALE